MRRLAEVPVVEPFPWERMLGYLGARLIPGAESVTEEGYERRHRGASLRVTHCSGSGRLQILVDGAADADDVARRVARLFDTGYDARATDGHLRACPIVGPRVERVPGVRPLGCWDPFELCVRTVAGQQVSVAAAGTLTGRLVERCGELSPAALQSADLTAIGMTRQRVRALQCLAEAVIAGSLVLENRPWTEIDAGLARLPGFGPWTRTYLAIRLGRQSDAFPGTDLGLLRAAGAASPAALEGLSRRWRPYRAYAATYLWSVG